MSGLFVAIVGPSGVGKDSLIRAAAERFACDERFLIVKRVVTRPSDSSEDHHTLSLEAFEAAERAGAFALVWRAHGLAYGVPIEICGALDAERTVICNLSRGAVAAARARFARVFAVQIQAKPETLAARIAARGRESGDKVGERLARAGDLSFHADATVDNDGTLETAADELVRLIKGKT